MSHHWDIGCRTCNVSSGVLRENHGRERLLELLQGDTPQRIAVAGEAAQMLDAFVYGAANGLRLFVDLSKFFSEHYLSPQHVFGVIDQYGKWDDECARAAVCPACQHVHDCSQKTGHEGPHTRRIPS